MGTKIVGNSVVEIGAKLGIRIKNKNRTREEKLAERAARLAKQKALMQRLRPQA